MKKDNLKEFKDNEELVINMFPLIGLIITLLALIFYFFTDRNRILNLKDNLYILSPFIRYTIIYIIYKLVFGKKRSEDGNEKK